MEPNGWLLGLKGGCVGIVKWVSFAIGPQTCHCWSKEHAFERPKCDVDRQHSRCPFLLVSRQSRGSPNRQPRSQRLNDEQQRSRRMQRSSDNVTPPFCGTLEGALGPVRAPKRGTTPKTTDKGVGAYKEAYTVAAEKGKVRALLGPSGLARRPRRGNRLSGCIPGREPANTPDNIGQNGSRSHFRERVLQFPELTG